MVPGDRLVLGSRAVAGWRVDDDTVSGLHCELWLDEWGLGFRDLDSTNGLHAGGVRVNEGRLRADGGCFVMGETLVSAESLGAEEPCFPAPIPGLVGDSPAMRRLVRQIRAVAVRRAPVLIQGESGSGKDVVARALHELSGRTGAYVPINVATIPESLADSELFGHSRGAFTGAVSSRKGAFEVAHRGTLFLDEIADLSPAVQGKLLRVVEDGEVRALGGGKPLRVDVRLVCASWASLTHRVEVGAFRADLLQRISTLVLEVPPLRDRRADIPALVESLLARFEPDLGAHRLTGAALSRLTSHSWPGNVRELAGVVYRAAADADGFEVDLGAVERALPKLTGPRRIEGVDARRLVGLYGGNVSAAAKAVGVPRSTFRFWLERGEGGQTPPSAAEPSSRELGEALVQRASVG